MTSGNSSRKSNLPVPEIIDHNLQLSRKEPRRRSGTFQSKKPPKLNTKYHDTSLNRNFSSSSAQAISFKSSCVEEPTLLSSIYNKDTSLSYYDQCFETISKIGEGSFGEVFKVRSREDGLIYAVKKSKQFFRSEKYREERLEEVRRYEQFSEHDHCVTLHRAWEQDDRLFMQMELCQGNLEEYIIERKTLAESVVWSILLDILLALKALHDRNLVHLDIKLDNILIGNDGSYKLADFGLVVDVTRANMCQATEGDSRYVAPELMQGHFSKAADIFSLGIAILELSCNLDLPPHGPLWQQLRCGTLPKEFIRTISGELQQVIKSMMRPNPFDRPNVDQLLAHKKLQHIKHLRGRFTIFRKMAYSIHRSGRYFIRQLCNLKSFLYHLISYILTPLNIKESLNSSFDSLQTDSYYSEFPCSPQLTCLDSYSYDGKIINSTPLNCYSTSFRRARKDVSRISFSCDSSDQEDFSTSNDHSKYEHIPSPFNHEFSSLICKKLFISDDSD